MGKAIGGLSGSPPLSEGESSDERVEESIPSIGSYLARQRRLRGIELEELAAVTRIPRRSLERLESGAFDGVTDGFVRGFVRTVADAIGLDPDDAVTRMLAEPVVGPARSWPQGLFTPLALAGGLVLLLVLGFWWAIDTDSAPVVAEAEVTPAVVPTVQSGVAFLRRDAVRELAREQGMLGRPGIRPVTPPGSGGRGDVPRGRHLCRRGPRAGTQPGERVMSGVRMRPAARGTELDPRPQVSSGRRDLRACGARRP